MSYFYELFKDYGINHNFVGYVSLLALTLIMIASCVVSYYVAKMIVLKIITGYVKRSKHKYDDILLEKKFFQRGTHIVPIIIIYLFAPLFAEYDKVIGKAASTYLIIISFLLMISVLNTIDDIYQTFEISKTKPIKGLLQIVQVIIYIIAAIAIIANLLGEKPMALLGGIGALSAVFSLVFKDPILGFVAGIQLTSTDMLRIGDWIDVPKHSAEGTVLEMNLTTVKIEAFDKTTITIPNYTLVIDSFKNWRGMETSGGRRIKRSIYIDMNSIKFCTDQMLERFKNFHYLDHYIKQKEIEIASYNEENGVESDYKINGRRLTNIGVFRIYIENYLKHNPYIHKNMIHMVRQLPPIENGIPLEIYAFTNTIQWTEYENIQSDIFDHIMAVANEFELRIFQNPAGYDMKQISLKNSN